MHICDKLMVLLNTIFLIPMMLVGDVPVDGEFTVFSLCLLFIGVITLVYFIICFVCIFESDYDSYIAMYARFGFLIVAVQLGLMKFFSGSVLEDVGLYVIAMILVICYAASTHSYNQYKD